MTNIIGTSCNSDVIAPTVASLCANMDSEKRMQTSPISLPRKIVRGDMESSRIDQPGSPFQIPTVLHGTPIQESLPEQATRCE